jgi:hypothetical protein
VVVSPPIEDRIARSNASFRALWGHPAMTCNRECSKAIQACSLFLFRSYSLLPGFIAFVGPTHYVEQLWCHNGFWNRSNLQICADMPGWGRNRWALNH